MGRNTGGVGVFLWISWLGKNVVGFGVFSPCLWWPRALKNHKNDENRQGDDLAIVSPSKGKRSSPLDHHLTRVIKSYLLALGTTQISLVIVYVGGASRCLFRKLNFTLDWRFPPRIKKLTKKMQLQFLRLWACPKVHRFSPRESEPRETTRATSILVPVNHELFRPLLVMVLVLMRMRCRKGQKWRQIA